MCARVVSRPCLASPRFASRAAAAGVERATENKSLRRGSPCVVLNKASARVKPPKPVSSCAPHLLGYRGRALPTLFLFLFRRAAKKSRSGTKTAVKIPCVPLCLRRIAIRSSSSSLSPLSASSLFEHPPREEDPHRDTSRAPFQVASKLARAKRRGFATSGNRLFYNASNKPLFPRPAHLFARVLKRATR